jgi:hypothetical protein
MTISSEEVQAEFKAAREQGRSAGQMAGGAPSDSDQDAAGGSGGTGGYGTSPDTGLAQNRANGPDSNPEHPATRELSRGERFDADQGGGRASDAVDFEAVLTEDGNEADSGAVTEGQQP